MAPGTPALAGMLPMMPILLDLLPSARGRVSPAADGLRLPSASRRPGRSASRRSVDCHAPHDPTAGGHHH